MVFTPYYRGEKRMEEDGRGWNRREEDGGDREEVEEDRKARLALRLGAEHLGQR